MVNVSFFKGPDMFAEFSRVSVFVCRNDLVWFLYLVLQLFKSDVCFSGAVFLTCDGGPVD